MHRSLPSHSALRKTRRAAVVGTAALLVLSLLRLTTGPVERARAAITPGVLFDSALEVATGDQVATFASGDFDGDGDLDIAANETDYPGTTPTSIEIVLNNGQDVYERVSANDIAGVINGHIQAGQLNVGTDSFVDLVWGEDAAAGTVSVAFGNGDATFDAPVALPSSGVGYFDTLIADFNGDTFNDVAAASYWTDAVLVWLDDGTGTGTFGSPQTVSTGVGTGPSDLDVADYDADSDLDLFSANYASTDGSVLTNDGSGSFAATTVAVGTGQLTVHAGTFDGDTKPDLVFGEYLGGGIQYLQNGTVVADTPVFAAAVSTATGGSNTSDSAAADFDEDGTLDVAWTDDGTVDTALYMMLNDGSGSFTASTQSFEPLEALNVEVGDFDSDGNVDIVTGRAGSIPFLDITYGRGNGTLRYLTELQTSVFGGAGDTHRVDVGDINGDTWPDIAAANEGTCGGDVDIFYNDGAGTFPTTPSQSLHAYAASDPGCTNVYTPFSVILADFNGDTFVDVLLADISHVFDDDLMHLWLNDGTGPTYFDGASDAAQLTRTANAPDVQTGYSDVRAVDIDGDLDLDLVPMNFHFDVYENDGSAAFTRLFSSNTYDQAFGGTSEFFSPSGSAEIESGDVNKDGTPDFSAAAAGDTFGEPTAACPSTFPSMRSALNIAFGDSTSSFELLPVVTYSPDDGIFPPGVGCLPPEPLYPSQQNVEQGPTQETWSSTIGDFDGDTWLDVVGVGFDTSTETGFLNFYANDGVGNIPTTPTGTYTFPSTIDVEMYDSESTDVNGDGFLDMVAVDDFNGTVGRVQVLLGNGDGTFNDPVAYDGGIRQGYTRLSDVNKDGSIDLVVSQDNRGTVSVINGRVIAAAPPTPGVLVTESGGSTNIVECGATDTYTVVLLSQPTANVTVTVSPNAQQTVNPSALTFTTVNWATPQTVTVSATQDGIGEGSHTGLVTHAATSTDPAYDGIAVASVTTQITEACTTTTTPPVVTRVCGDDPASQAICVSKARFADRTASAAIFARDDVFIDAFTGTPLSTGLNATLLLTPTGNLDSAALAELQRATINTDVTVYLLGREQALDPQVEADLKAAGYGNLVRLGGINRDETATKIGGELVKAGKASSKIELTENERLVDALGVGAIAGDTSDGKVDIILLTQRGNSQLNSFTEDFVTSTPGFTSAEIIGGTSAVPDSAATALAAIPGITSVERVSGATRWDTNVALAAKYRPTPTSIVVASGEKSAIPGALSILNSKPGTVEAFAGQSYFYATLLAGTLAADEHSPLLIVQSAAVPQATVDYIVAHAATITSATVVGTLEQVSQAVQDFIASII